MDCSVWNQTVLILKDLEIVFNLPINLFITKGPKHVREELKNTLLSCSQHPSKILLNIVLCKKL